MRPVVDGQKQPRPEPLTLSLRDLDILRLPQPWAVEITVDEFIRNGGWLETISMEFPNEPD